MVVSVNGVYGPRAPKDAVQANNLVRGIVTSRFPNMTETTVKDPFLKHKNVMLLCVQVREFYVLNASIF